MKGAREFSELFKTGQYGKLYIVSGSHARGRTFHIQVLPEGEKAVANGTQNLCTNSNAVEVYGVVSGNPGWTETYDWLHKGKWCEDFEKLVSEKKKEIEMRNKSDEYLKEQRLKADSNKIASLLSQY